MACQCAVALGLALLLGIGTIPAAYGDDGEDTVVVAVIPSPTPPDDATPGTGDVGSGTGDAATDFELPLVQNQPPAENPVPGDPGLAPVVVPMPLQQRTPEGLVADSQEAVPATDKATPTPAPSITSEASATAVPIALPEPVSKTIDALVATASGSPLHVQLLTVRVLIGAGIAYFRVLGSKGTRVPSKSVK